MFSRSSPADAASIAAQMGYGTKSGTDGVKQSIVETVTEAQLNEFKDAFSQFDVDKSGHIDQAELARLCEYVGSKPSDEEVTEMMKLADGDGSGEIDVSPQCLERGAPQPLARHRRMPISPPLRQTVLGVCHVDGVQDERLG